MPGEMRLIASKNDRDDSILIHQDADVYLGRIDAAATLEHAFTPGRAGWIEVIEGELAANGTVLRSGDGAATEGEDRMALKSAASADFLLFDLQ